MSQGPDSKRTEIVNDRFEIVGVLGTGAQGETLMARDANSGQVVALKRFFVRGAKSWKDVELAEREALVQQGLAHPNLPRYVTHFEHEGALCLVTERIEGESLAQLLATGRTLTQPEVLRFLQDAASALAYLHALSPPLIHRDIKPANVLRRPDGSFAIVDFGSVQHRLRETGGSTVAGTFGFMAPEQLQGRAGPESDVYAAAAPSARIAVDDLRRGQADFGVVVGVAGQFFVIGLIELDRRIAAPGVGDEAPDHTRHTVEHDVDLVRGRGGADDEVGQDIGRGLGKRRRVELDVDGERR